MQEYEVKEGRIRASVVGQWWGSVQDGCAISWLDYYRHKRRMIPS